MFEGHTAKFENVFNHNSFQLYSISQVTDFTRLSCYCMPSEMVFIISHDNLQ